MLQKLLIAIPLVLLLLWGAVELLEEGLSLHRVRSEVERAISAALDEPVRISGVLRPDLLLTPTLEAGEIRVGDWLEIRKLGLELSPVALLRGAVHVTGLELEGVELRIDSAAEEELAELELEDLILEPEEVGVSGDGLEIRRVAFRDLRILLLGEPGDPIRVLEFAELRLEADELVASVELEARGGIEGRPFKLKGRFGPLREVVQPTEPYPARLTGHLGNARFEIDVMLERADRLEGMDLRLGLQIPELEPWIPEAAPPLPPLGPLVASGRLRHPAELMQLDQLQVRVQSGTDATASIHGQIADLAGGAGIQLDVRVEFPGTGGLHGRLEQAVGRELPRLGPGLLTGRVEGSVESLALSDLDAEVGRHDRLWARATGGIDDLLDLEGLGLELAIELRDLEPLRADLTDLLADEPPELGPLQATARLEGSFEAPVLLGLDARLGGPSGAWLQAHGAVDDLARLSGVKLDLSGELPDLRLLQPWLELDDPRPLGLGPLAARARLHGDASTLGLADLEARLGLRSSLWAEVRGSVGDLLAFRGISLSGQAGAADLGDLSSVVDVGELDLAGLGPLGLAADLRDADGSLGVERFEGRLGRRGTLFVEVQGAFDDLAEIDEIDVQIAWEARDLELIGDLAGLELPARGPVAGRGRLAGSNERLRSTGTLRIDTTEFIGETRASFPEAAPPSIHARIRSEHVHLDELIVPEPEERGEETPAEAAGWWDSQEPLPFQALRDVDLDVEIALARVTGRAGLDISNAHLALLLDGGELVVKDLAGDYQSGRVHAGLRVDARRARPRVELRAEVVGVDVGRVISQFQEDSDLTGNLHLATELAARGRTVPALRSTLSGRFSGAVREGTIASALGKAFVFNLVRSIWPKRTPPADAPVHCLLAGLEIDDGLATLERFFVEGPDSRVHATGTIDLARSLVDVRLHARARNPGLVSIVPSVDVVGPLHSPSIKLIKRSVATSMARGVTSNALRPGSVALNRLGFRSRRDDPCAGALSDLSD